MPKTLHHVMVEALEYAEQLQKLHEFDLGRLAGIIGVFYEQRYRQEMFAGPLAE